MSKNLRFLMTGNTMCLTALDLCALRPDDVNLRAAADKLEQLKPVPSNVERLVRAARLVEAMLGQRPGVRTILSGPTTDLRQASANPSEVPPSAPLPTDLPVPRTGQAPPEGTGEDPGSPAAKTTQKRERGPDLEKSQKRVDLENILRGELATIVVRKKKFVDLPQLKREMPEAKLWQIITTPSEQKELLTEVIKPRAYARSLVSRHFGVTAHAIKYDHTKLRKAKK